MNKEKIIKILEDYEYFVDDDYGGHYENINCSQKALTPLGILNILDYIDELKQENKQLKEVIEEVRKYIEDDMYYTLSDGNTSDYVIEKTEKELLQILDKIKELEEGVK